MARDVGTPTWIDLITPDVEAAKAFYGGLLGWEMELSGTERDQRHTVRSGGRVVAGAASSAGMTPPGGEPVPAAWTIFLAVDDIDARVELAQRHGAQVLVPVDAAGDEGRFAVLRDPAEAVVGLWQAGAREGYEEAEVPGAPAWFEVLTQDLDASAAFYRDVLGLDPVPMTTPEDEGGPTYVTHGPPEEASSGMCDVAGFVPPEAGSWWRVYLTVADCDEGAARAQELGGRLLDGPTDSPFGRIATLADPAGATFQVVTPGDALPDAGGEPR